jgi:hypothetical protein
MNFMEASQSTMQMPSYSRPARGEMAVVSENPIRGIRA